MMPTGRQQATAPEGKDQRIISLLLRVWSRRSPMFVPTAQLDEKTRFKMECKRCGHSWFRKNEEGPHICPECNAPCEDKEHCNVNRKN